MQSDPVEDWRRLTALYGEMGDLELRELAAEIGDLTEMAQQVLRDEMKKRGIKDEEQPREAPWTSVSAEAPLVDQFDDSTTAAEGDHEGDLSAEYTWKTPLCECEDRQQAWQIHEVLKRAGIESWIEAPKSYAIDLSGPQVLVAADQLGEAREIVARPIPQEIIEESKMDVPEFELPLCPKCGAADPTLESADPSNTWLCESCGEQWTESAGDLKGNPRSAAQ